MDFQPTHLIVFSSGVPPISVRAVDQVLYTADEWDSETAADWEIRDGVVTFQGAARPGAQLLTFERLAELLSTSEGLTDADFEE